MAKLFQITSSKKGGIVSLHKFANWSYKDLSTKFQRPVSTIKSICKHYDIYGTVYNKGGAGRRPRLSGESEERLMRSVRRDPKKSAGYWGRTADLSRQQTCRVLKKHNLRYRMCCKKPFISAANALKRLKWAADNEGTDWRKVMFTDECCLKIGEISGQQHCWRADGKAYDPTTMQVYFRPGKSIHIWGAIRHGKKLSWYWFKLAPARQRTKVKIRAETINAAVYSAQVLWGPLLLYVNQAKREGVDNCVVENGA